MKRSSFLIIPLILAACGGQIPSAPASATPLPPPTSTLPVLTPTTKPTRPLAQATITLPENYSGVEHPDTSQVPYVFTFDEKIWYWAPITPWENGPLILNFALATDSNCTIETVPPRGIGSSSRLYFQQFGSRNWLVYEYSLDSALVQHQELFLDLRGRMDVDCRRAQDKFLAGVLHASEYYSGPTVTPYVTPTLRPGLEGFDCPGALPVTLRVGDIAQIIANSVWLRSEPRREEATQIKQYLQYASDAIIIEEGPVCVGGYVYWQVNAQESGEGGQSVAGWMAESNRTEYFLRVFDSGW